ncbi:acid phosphatase [Alkalimonas amylolytica]|uniref:Acid phosphatase n=1 Tax=Alkalimonas amylolytica TaxID=152573 RepID=A0A1H4EY37_ALKAM|nr:phosphatase PAP2 family protein [Alkalimonas amylolytica]SEA89983.1 acid phosphatase (class A) [Alkalimonas amylolytica]
MRDVPEAMPGYFVGYLTKDELPSSMALLPPYPAGDSAAFALDQQIQLDAKALRGSPRWELAASDADLDRAHALGTFDCALGVAITAEDTPRLFQLLQRTMMDAVNSTNAAKFHYSRARPFMALKQSTCSPDDEDQLRGPRSGSYPSGHTALGWAAALVLAEVAPDSTDAVLMRGRSYGESRLVCNVHWLSDILQGRHLGAATVARLQSVPEFREDVEVARQELARARAKNSGPNRDCAAEAAALSQRIPGVL